LIIHRVCQKFLLYIFLKTIVTPACGRQAKL